MISGWCVRSGQSGQIKQRCGRCGRAVDRAVRSRLTERSLQALQPDDLGKLPSAPVRVAFFPKKNGGDRTLGVPTVFNRIAQMSDGLVMLSPVSGIYAKRRWEYHLSSCPNLPNHERFSRRSSSLANFASATKRSKLLSAAGPLVMCCHHRFTELRNAVTQHKWRLG